MFCRKCGQSIPDQAKFCGKCGTPVQAPPGPPSSPLGQETIPIVASSPDALPGSGSKKILIIIAAGGVVILLIVLAVIFFLFSGFQMKAKQSEAKTNLGAIFTGEVSFFGEKNTYGSTFQQINFRPEGKTRYAYFLPGEVIQSAIGGPYSLPAGVAPYVSDTGFQVVAVGNIDRDPALDVWIINDQKLLQNVVNDVTESEPTSMEEESDAEEEAPSTSAPPPTSPPPASSNAAGLPVPSYVIAASAADSEQAAGTLAGNLRNQGYPAGYLWIPNYASLSGAQKFLVYIGPYTNVDDARPVLARYQSVNSAAYGIKVDTSPGRYTFTAAGGGGPSAGGSPSEITNAIARYAQTEQEMNLDAHMALYGSYVSWYGKNISNAQLRNTIGSVFWKSASMDMQIDNVNVSMRGDSYAVAEFNKYFRYIGTGGKKDFCGEVRAVHELQKENGQWLVVAVRELKVFWVEKGNCANKSRDQH